MRNTVDPGAVEGDLRPVTVLFADIHGFTRLAELLPPEQLVGAINGCFEVLDEGIAHYGGEIDKFLGDAIMATFGESLTHDDDPRRAVLAALEMQMALSQLNARLRKQIGCELEMRIGINTGLVLAGPIGSRRKRSFTVMGDAVNVAARLEQAAPVGGILIGEATRAYLGNSFRLRLRRSVRIRGKDAPVRSFVVLGQATAPRNSVGGDRYLGRTGDLEQAIAGLAPLRAGKRAVVEIDGGVGIGKSALALAIRRAAGRSRGWLNVACPPYGQDLPYTTLAGLLRGLIQRMDSAHTLESTLAASPDAEGLDVNLAAAVVHDLLAQSSEAVDSRTSSLTAQLRKGLLARTTKTLLRAASARQPLVVAMDDCHWLDAASAVIIAEAIGDLHDSPLGWLILHRPGWALPTGFPVDSHIRLEALDAKTSAALAKTFLGQAASEQTIAFVVERAEGNPLYLVELCGAVSEAGIPPESRAAAEAHAQPTHLTDQLRSLLLSRIDSPGVLHTSRPFLGTPFQPPCCGACWGGATGARCWPGSRSTPFCDASHAYAATAAGQPGSGISAIRWFRRRSTPACSRARARRCTAWRVKLWRRCRTKRSPIASRCWRCTSDAATTRSEPSATCAALAIALASCT